jgi:hypothetical protein
MALKNQGLRSYARKLEEHMDQRLNEGRETMKKLSE